MAIKIIDKNIINIEGFSIRAEGAAVLIVDQDQVIAMFEMQTNKLTITNNRSIAGSIQTHITDITRGWGTEIEYLDHSEFQKLIYNNFKVVV
jgi:hypothetical protein